MVEIHVLPANYLDLSPSLNNKSVLLPRMKYFGSPFLGGTWVEEGLLKIVKKISSLTHRRVWTLEMILHFNEVARLEPPA